jgi:hypothetical protein
LKATVSRWTDNFPTSLEGTAYPWITLSFPVASLNLSELRTLILPLPSVDSESVEIRSQLVYKTITSNVLYMVFTILSSSIDHSFFKKRGMHLSSGLNTTNCKFTTTISANVVLPTIHTSWYVVLPAIHISWYVVLPAIHTSWYVVNTIQNFRAKFLFTLIVLNNGNNCRQANTGQNDTSCLFRIAVINKTIVCLFVSPDSILFFYRNLKFLNHAIFLLKLRLSSIRHR